VDFLRRPVTPRAVWRFECRLARLLWEIGRLVMQQSLTNLEPHDPEALSRRLRLGQHEYRRNLRLILKSNLWSVVRRRWLATHATCERESRT
jgi:hypothetical protein